MLYDKKWDYRADTAIRDVLVEARRLIEDPEDWCQQYQMGESICAVHAIQKACVLSPHVREVDAIRALGCGMGLLQPGLGFVEGHWNDTHSHAEVLAAFDRAIAAQ
jgi:hypothetical protein